MADVEVRRDSFAETTTTTTKKTKKVKKTKRRESTDHGSEVTITEIEQTTTDNAIDDQEGYVNELNPIHHQQPTSLRFFLSPNFFLSISAARLFHFYTCVSLLSIGICIFPSIFGTPLTLSGALFVISSTVCLARNFPELGYLPFCVFYVIDGIPVGSTNC